MSTDDGIRPHNRAGFLGSHYGHHNSPARPGSLFGFGFGFGNGTRPDPRFGLTRARDETNQKGQTMRTQGRTRTVKFDDVGCDAKDNAVANGQVASRALADAGASGQGIPSPEPDLAGATSAAGAHTIAAVTAVGVPPASAGRHGNSPPQVESVWFRAPMGRLALITVAGELVRICLTESAAIPALAEVLRFTGGVRVRSGTTMNRVRAQLTEYFSGDRAELSIPIRIVRAGPFQRRVYAAAIAIPSGSTQTYGAIARTVGNPLAVRAVGVACARNPLPLVIPSHRIVGSDGRPGGVATPDYPARCWLLEREADHRV